MVSDIRFKMIYPETFFRDLVVIELASVLAGPSVGRFFAEHSARVIKIENPTQGGDVTRSWRNRNEQPDGISAYYASVNQGKEVVMLNLKLEEDRQKLWLLLEKADIFLTNFRFGEDQKLGVDLRMVRQRFPKIIVGQIDAFDSRSSRPAYDLVLQAESGYLSMSGTTSGELVKMPVAFIDILAGHQLKAGILMALMHRSKTDEGCLTRVSLMDVAVSSLMNQATNYLMTEWVPEPLGTLHPNICPYGEFFDCSDGGRLILAVGNNKQFESMLEVLAVDERFALDRYSTNQLRVMHRDELWDALKPYFKKKPRSYWLQQFALTGVPAGAIHSLREVFENGRYDWLIESRGSGLEQMRSVRVSAIKFE